MNRIHVHGLGAVSPAGWGVPALLAVMERGEPLPTQSLARPGWEAPLRVRQVPPPTVRPAFLAHPRLRRASAITQYALAAVMEALGTEAAQVQTGSRRLGIVVCVIAGSISYTRRFYEELLRDPATASPLVFPETVFNAPASHLAAYLGVTGPNYTLVGDNGTYLQGLALAADWLLNGRADGCVVVGAEESDWIMADALKLFQPRLVHASGAGALYLQKGEEPGDVAELAAVTDAVPFVQRLSRSEAARRMRAQLPAGGSHELLCLSTPGASRADQAEEMAWHGWSGGRMAPQTLLGEGFTASAAWQCVLACETLRRAAYTAANVSVVGVNQQAIGARFTAVDSAVARFLACALAGDNPGSARAPDDQTL